MTTVERATNLINLWIGHCLFLTPGQQAIKLIDLVAQALDAAEQRGIDRFLEKEGSDGNSTKTDI